MTEFRPSSPINRARASLRQTVVSYSQHLRSAKKRMPNPRLEIQLEAELAKLNTMLTKIDRNVVRLAVFGLVSRGKSAVINALLGEDLLETGPINGVTQTPRVIQWQPGGLPYRSRHPRDVFGHQRRG